MESAAAGKAHARNNMPQEQNLRCVTVKGSCKTKQKREHEWVQCVEDQGCFQNVDGSSRWRKSIRTYNRPGTEDAPKTNPPSGSQELMEQEKNGGEVQARKKCSMNAKGENDVPPQAEPWQGTPP